MKNLKKEPSKVKGQEEETSTLYEQFLNSKPIYASNAEAVRDLTRQMNALAEKIGKPIKEILHEREYGATFNEDYEQIASLSRSIWALKQIRG